MTMSARTKDIVVFRSSPVVDRVALEPCPPDVEASQLVEIGSETWLPVGRAWNQLLEKSKKHRSDQLQEVRKRIKRRNEQ